MSVSKNATPPSSVIAALVALALLGGCGSGSGRTASTGGAASSASTAATSATGPTSSAGVAAVAACKQIVQAQTDLPVGAKSKLETACAKAASGDQATVKRVAREVCEEAVNSSSLPAAAKRQVAAACSK
jgi:hypothetical protein